MAKGLRSAVPVSHLFGVTVRGLLGRGERRAEHANISYVRVYPEVIFAGIAAPKRRKEMIQPRLRPASG